MKVGKLNAIRMLVLGMLTIAVSASLLMITPSTAMAAKAQKIKDPKRIIARAKLWVDKRIGYSQSSYYRGYRRDCSGFVSMAWGYGKSYTSSTIRYAAKKIKKSQLRPGDAVRVPGHVSIFAGWKNKAKGEYYALEQTTWGSHAKKRVRKFTASATALRSRYIS